MRPSVAPSAAASGEGQTLGRSRSLLRHAGAQVTIAVVYCNLPLVLSHRGVFSLADVGDVEDRSAFGQARYQCRRVAGSAAAVNTVVAVSRHTTHQDLEKRVGPRAAATRADGLRQAVRIGCSTSRSDHSIPR